MRIWNERETALNEAMEGIMAAQPDMYCRVPNLYSYTMHKKNISDNRVQVVVSGGGSYGPLFSGFVGEGLADAVSHGDFDCAPNAYAIYEVSKIIDRGKGILFLTNNFTGDYLNNDMAQELLANEGIESRVCYASDDIFSAKGEEKKNRGGLCGIAQLIKIASAACDAGLSLDEVYRIVEKANDRLRSISICIDENKRQIEFGTGFSGEAPAYREQYVSADQLANQVVQYLHAELKEYASEQIIYFSVNRMAHTSYLEGYVLLTAIKKAFENMRYQIGGCSSGMYFDAYDRKGCIISAIIADPELEKFLIPVKGYDFTI